MWTQRPASTANSRRRSSPRTSASGGSLGRALRPVVPAAVLLVVACGLTACSGKKASSPTTTPTAGVVSTPHVDTVVVPSLVGLREAAARDRIEGLGFEALVRAQASPQPTGIVVSQNPAAGVELVRGGAI